MPFNVGRTAVIVEKEILRSAAGLDDVKSMVIDSTLLTVWPADSGRYIVEMGEVLGLVSGGDGKLVPISMGDYGSGSAGAWVAADIAGVMGHTREFWMGDTTQTAFDENATDEPVPVFHHGCNFDTEHLLGYSGNETIVGQALPTCLFT